jgi:hypothetical protein
MDICQATLFDIFISKMKVPLRSYFACFLERNPEQYQKDQLMVYLFEIKYNLKNGKYSTSFVKSFFWGGGGWNETESAWNVGHHLA